MSDTRTVHVITPLDPFNHRASSQCPCRPTVAYDLETPSRLVFVHNRDGQPKEQK